MNSRRVEIEVAFNGKRRALPTVDGGVYRPHFRIAEGEYLGVAFVAGSKPLRDMPSWAVVALLYEPNVDYSALSHGVAFEVFEGGDIVGSGSVVRPPFQP